VALADRPIKPVAALEASEQGVSLAAPTGGIERKERYRPCHKISMFWRW
jgi:hypothetical protein